MMMQNVAKIEWKDYTESIPAFLIIIRHSAVLFQLQTDWRWD